MIKKIGNEKLQIEVSTRGGELQSIKDKSGLQFLWQGDDRYWSDRALNIFPYVARMTDGEYVYDGKKYPMKIHGFVPYTELVVEQEEEHVLSMSLTADEKSMECYPFLFRYTIRYALEGTKLSIAYKVENLDTKPMFFGIGGHPGFNVPLDEGLSFDDYELLFADTCVPVRIGFTEDCFLNGDNHSYPLKEDKRIPLTHDLFDEDAVVMSCMDKKVTLYSPKGKHKVTVEYPQMSYLGIWHAPHTDAPYVCIEPWSSLPSRKDVVENLAQQSDLIRLEQGKTYENHWTIEFE